MKRGIRNTFIVHKVYIVHWEGKQADKISYEKAGNNETIHVVNVSLNVSLSNDHQMLKYQSLDSSML